MSKSNLAVKEEMEEVVEEAILPNATAKNNVRVMYNEKMKTKKKIIYKIKKY